MTGPLFDDIFGHRPGVPPKAPAKPLPTIRGKRIDGVLYVRAEDVADALASQAPTVNSRLITKLRSAS